MSPLALVLLIIVLVLVFGGLPRWGYHSWLCARGPGDRALDYPGRVAPHGPALARERGTPSQRDGRWRAAALTPWRWRRGKPWGWWRRTAETRTGAFSVTSHFHLCNALELYKDVKALSSPKTDL